MIRKHSAPLAQFREKGFRAREFFPHTAAVIPKRYPDTLLLLEGCGMTRPELLGCGFCQLNLYSEWTSGLPDELFTDFTVNWHHQQLGERALIAAAGICMRDSSLLVSLLQSDLCQQLFRHKRLQDECKTQVKKRFAAWHKFLFNAVLDFAVDSGITAVYSPTAEWMLRAIRKPVHPDLFHRVYNFAEGFHGARRVVLDRAEYWEIPVAANADRIARLLPGDCGSQTPGKLICIFHDTEENLAEDVPPEECRDNLTRMLRIEKAAGVRTTYNVVGSLFARKQEEIRAAGAHCLAFHSYDHVLENDGQLPRCREVDLQIRGYRTPQSRVTAELTDYALSYYNFEWLATGLRSLIDSHTAIDWEWMDAGFTRLGAKCCGLQNGIVKIPVLVDDNLMSTRQMDYPEWRRRLIEIARHSELLSFGLHDCYARYWIEAYAELLETLSGFGHLVTGDELCDMTFRNLG